MKNLLVGILIGALVAFVFLNRGNEVKPTPAETSIATNEHKPSSVKIEPTKIRRLNLKKISKPKRLKNWTINKASTTKNVEVDKKEKPKKKVHLNLNEFSVGLLEGSWDELPDHATSERLDNGWRVRFKKKDNFFSRFGFKDGDVINYHSLETGELNDDQSELMERVVAILRHIEE